jgi:large subunit ribosomal protein L5
MKEFQYTNPMRVPKLTKLSSARRLKEATSDGKVVEKAIDELSTITGQKPKMTRAKKAIAAFKLRQGMPLGAFSTLRRSAYVRIFGSLHQYCSSSRT